MPSRKSVTLDLSSLMRHERAALALIAAGQSLGHVLDELVCAVETLRAGMRGSVWLLQPGGSRLCHCAAPSLPDGYDAAIEALHVSPFDAALAIEPEAIHVSNIATDPLWASCRALALSHGLRTCRSTPIHASDGSVLGVFVTYYSVSRPTLALGLDIATFAAHTAGLVIERHFADKALRDSEDRYRHVVELNALVAWTSTPDGQFDHIAERWQEWTGITALGKPWTEAVHPDDVAPTHRAWLHSQATGAPYDIEHRLRLRDGNYRWIRSRAYPRRNTKTEIVKWYGTTEDVDQRHRTEDALREREVQLQRLNATLDDSIRARTDELTALTRHLQNVQELDRSRLARLLHDELGAVFTTAKMDGVRLKARMGTLPPPTAERLQHLLATLDDGIAIKRRLIEELRPSALTNLGLVEALRILMSDFARHGPCTIEAHLDEMLLTPTVQITIYRLIQEALTNVERHARAGHVVVRLLSADATHARVSVSDNGVGFNVDAPRPGAHGLTGLRYRIEAEGGRFCVTSSTQGTRMAATLPLLPAHDENFVLPAELIHLVN